MSTKNIKADGSSKWESNRYAKKQKAKLERRKAKKDPEVTPGYGKYKGYVL